jgi:hypothetical protein
MLSCLSAVLESHFNLACKDPMHRLYPIYGFPSCSQNSVTFSSASITLLEINRIDGPFETYYLKPILFLPYGAV